MNNSINNRFTKFAFAGLISLNIVGTNMMPPRDSTITGEINNKFQEKIESRILERVENRQERFKDKRVVLKDVKVAAVGTTTLSVDNDGSIVTVNINNSTQLRRRFWGKSNISEFSVGNVVSVVGKWTDDTKTAVNAVLIRNESIQKKNGTFFGTVKSLSGTGFVMATIHRSDETVTIGSAKLTNRKGETITQADIKVGDRVRVKGLWDSSLKTITEVREVKNFSLPPLPSRVPRASGSPSVSSTQ